MTPKRILLILLTALAFTFIGADLLASLNKPQFQSRLGLYEADLRLHVSEWQGDGDAGAVKKLLQDKPPILTALDEYKEVRDQAGKSLAQSLSQVAKLRQAEQKPAILSEIETQKAAIAQQEKAMDELDLRIGLLQAELPKQRGLSLQTWAPLLEKPNATGKAAQALTQLWSPEQSQIPSAQSIEQGLDGWFRYRALARLYERQKDEKALALLKSNEQEIAETALTKIGLTGALSIGSIGLGSLTALGLLGQFAVKRKESILSGINNVRWPVPWNAEVLWQVIIVGFFLVGQVVMPVLFGTALAALNLNPTTMTERGRAFYILCNYLGLAGGGLTVLYFSIRSYFPLTEEWFNVNAKGRWFLWSFGGFLVAFPIVILVTLANQQIWQGNGGSNPILPFILQSKDPASLVLFFLTAAIAAPFFEETLFRGFILPSLTRYMPTWGAILASSLLFAVVHLSLSEVAPLTALGIVLGFSYVKTRNLLVPMVLHGLWNASTLVSLFILGRGI
ncbi:MAG: CPBP family intramembrane metalloprotease [Alkalinema sp. RU_4_3]|nr:CPBP family intramembrane metalloprotease [Alkalinema sp. RU_4_3]